MVVGAGSPAASAWGRGWCRSIIRLLSFTGHLRLTPSDAGKVCPSGTPHDGGASRRPPRPETPEAMGRPSGRKVGGPRGHLPPGEQSQSPISRGECSSRTRPTLADAQHRLAPSVAGYPVGTSQTDSHLNCRDCTDRLRSPRRVRHRSDRRGSGVRDRRVPYETETKQRRSGGG